MTAAHEVSAEKEPINIAEKRQQYFDICEYRFNISFFRKDKALFKQKKKNRFF